MLEPSLIISWLRINQDTWSHDRVEILVGPLRQPLGGLVVEVRVGHNAEAGDDLKQKAGFD